MSQQVGGSDSPREPAWPSTDWVSVEANEDAVYEEIYEPLTGSAPPSRKINMASLPSIPPHSLVAFGLFLRLPGYAEVGVVYRLESYFWSKY